MPASASSPSRVSSATDVTRLAPAPPPVGPVWTVRLLGAIEAQAGTRNIRHWPSRATAQLLARLALAPDRIHPREELVELLWPGVDHEAGRNRLRQALSTLKRLLEAGSPQPVIVADRLALRAAPGALGCDVCAFERHLRTGEWEQAEQAYGGELMPGHYDDWVIEERGRLATLAERLPTMPRVAPGAQPARGAGGGPSPGQLPSFWTRLFGTEINATRLRELVRHHRLVTVFGTGGSGKTRLAIEVARALKEPAAWAPQGLDDESAFDHVTFVSLIDCTTAAQALDAVAAALQVVGRDPLRGIANGLAGQHTLLVLDNYEQLAGHAEGLVSQLLTDSATLHLLITSRQRLGLDGEQVFELAGLPLPEAGKPGPAHPRADDDAASGHPAIALFVDRARAAASDFALDAEQEGAVIELVRLLAGMPLAIELAASRMRSLSPRALLDLLGEGQTPMLDLLSRDAGPHSLAQRHASLRHVVDWSWRQLSPPLVTLMQALAAFAAPAHGETVAAVAELPAHTTRERLEQLRDQSLVVATRDSSGTPRYRLLQPVREFVLERTSAAVAAGCRQRLRQCLIEFGRRGSARGHHAIDDVDAELPQVYAAILAAAADGPAAQAQAVRLAVAFRRHWEVDTRAGLPLAVMQALEAALPQVDDPGTVCELCALLSLSGALAGLSAESMALAERALALADTPRRRAQALLRRAHLVIFSSQDQRALDAELAEALALARQAGDLETQGLALRMQFLVTVNRDDDHVAGERLAMQVQSLWEQLGHRRNAYSGLMDRATCWIAQGRLDEAATALSACEQVALQERHATGAIMSSWQLGRVSIRLRQAGTALAAFRRCLQGAWDHKRLAYVADALVLVPGGLAFCGEPEAAARLLGFAATHWQRQFGNFYRDLERDVRPTRRWLRQHLGAVPFETLRLQGVGLSLPDAVALGLGQPAGRTRSP